MSPIAPFGWRDNTTPDLDASNLEAMHAAAGAYADTVAATAQAASAQRLAPTAVKTSAYAAAAGDFVPVDISGGSVTVTLPSAPADRTRIGVKVVKVDGSHANACTVARAGSDVFNIAGGSTSLTLSALFQGVLLQYQASSGIWYVSTADTPLGQANGAAGLGTDGKHKSSEIPSSVVTDGSTRPQGSVLKYATTQAAPMCLGEQEQSFTSGGQTAVDCSFAFGYNFDPSTGTVITPGEPALRMQIESNYRSGSDNFMEWNIHHRTAAGVDYEPFNLTISRSDKSTYLQILTGLLDVAPDGVTATPVARFQQMGVIAQAFNTGQIELGSDTTTPTILFGSTGTASITKTTDPAFVMNKSLAITDKTLRVNAASAVSNNTGGLILGYDGVAGANAAAISFGGTNGDASIARTAAAALKTSGLFDAGFLRANSNTPAPTSGAGIEMQWDGTSGILVSFDRGASAYKPMVISGDSVVMRYRASSTSGFKVDGSGIAFYNHATAGQATITGSRGANAALASLLTALAATGLIVDSSTA